MRHVGYLTLAASVLVSADAAQLSDDFKWPGWLNALGGKGDANSKLRWPHWVEDNRSDSGYNSTNVTTLIGDNDTGVERSGGDITNVTLKASATAVPTGGSDGLAQGNSTEPMPSKALTEDLLQENARLRAEVEALRVPRAAVAETDPAAEEPAAPSGGNITAEAQSRGSSASAAPAAPVTSATAGGGGGWFGWLKKWGGQKKVGGNGTGIAQSGTDSRNFAQGGGSSASVAQDGGNSTSSAESGAVSADVDQSGGNRTDVAHNGENSANLALARDETAPAASDLPSSTEMTNVAPTSSLAPRGSAAAVGDPHLQNIHGERFDLMKPGKHVLIRIPRRPRAGNVLLRVDALVRRLGGNCADMYFQELNISGSWVPGGQTAGLHFRAHGAPREHARWLKLGMIEAKVAHGRTLQGQHYLNFYVKHLGRAGLPIGGLLGEDDHTEESVPSEACAHRLSLLQYSTPASEGAFLSSLAEASLA
ncbi:unnamed protein product [Prorocentrum cordatum]|uniref:Beta-galactosidase n=1 Tax=Prorocentrum cordatum TaxID=2364126 RepID=A0ABN9VXM7_9DINO|nr:unnamed protein product [Polarella glacialis]|mmetsp:Transcript_5203/g.13293  ORF Transcript_5203/g.13293 Transcript_5203/m.13293 type:complete len:479 (+) Transcript_5203:129-1565(+)